METDDTILDIESRSYVNPQTGLDERMQFIDTLRDVQAQNTAQINQNTYNLGSQVPSNVGGLTGSEGLWQAQYQTPQTDAQVANLKAVAQQQALNQETQNLQAVYQNRYKQALRDYYARRKKESDATKTPSDDDPSKSGDVEIISDIETVSKQAGQAPAGWAYVRNPMGGDRWYKIKEDGTIDYTNFVDKNPNTGSTWSYGGYNTTTGEDIVEEAQIGGGTFVTTNGKRELLK